MPIYEFTCGQCGHLFEALVPRPGAKSPCPACGSRKVEQRVSRPGGFTVKRGGAGTCPMTGEAKSENCGAAP